MKYRITITFLSLFLLNLSFGQDQEKYAKLTKVAWSLYESQEYQKSTEKYKEAFDQLEGKACPNDRYNAACSFALSGNVNQSFYHLFRVAEHPKTKYKNYNHITTDKDLSILHNDKRWDELIKIVKSNKEEAEKNYDKPLVAMLDTVYQEDQGLRRRIQEIQNKYGRDSKEMRAHWRLMNERDSINLIKVKKVLDERGWLGEDIIGRRGNSALFLVIQHADLETQEKYLPMMKEAVKLGNARPSNLALLEDRIALRQGKLQIYGSQISTDPETGENFVDPMIDPENVDKRRKEVGLGTIAEYIKYWGMTWDLQKHEERTKRMEEEKKEISNN